MMRRLLLPLAALGLMLAGLALAGPASAGDPCFHDMTRPPVSEGSATIVKIDRCAFSPTITRVPVGTEVQFVNADMVGHEIVGANLTWGHHDKILSIGDRLGVTFDKVGIYPYSCMIHPGMTGTVVVGSSDLRLVSDVQTPPASPVVADAGSGNTFLPILAAGGIGILAGALVTGAVASRRQRAG